MSGEVLRVLKAEFGDKKGDAYRASGNSYVSQKPANGLPAQENQGYPSFGIKGREPLTQDVFEYKGSKMTKSEAQRKSYSDVYSHESAHLTKAGKYATSGIHIDFDGNGMATGGHVNIAMPVFNPKDLDGTIEQAKTVEAAALAPSSFDELSDADKSVAAQARTVYFKALAMKEKKSSEQKQQGVGENLYYLG